MASSNIIKANVAYQKILQFEPQKLSMANFEQLNEMVRHMDANPEFQVAEVVRNFTGLAEMEGQRIESEIERQALEQLKSIQEEAYQEAYNLGLQEGQQKAFQDKAAEIDARLADLDELITNLRDLKVHYINNNENQLMKMILYLATKVAMFEISERPQEAIRSVLRRCITVTNEDEQMRVMVAPDQIQFLDLLKKERKKELNFLKNVEFHAEEGLSKGGCKIETNFSEIDARIEERVGRLWDEVLQSIPPIKDRLENE